MENHLYLFSEQNNLVNENEVKKHQFNKYISLLGVANNIFPLFVFFLACYASDFTCHGDSAGGIMMVYALGFFIPQVIVFILITIYFIVVFSKSVANLGWESFSVRDKASLSVYLVTFMVLILLNFSANMFMQ